MNHLAIIKVVVIEDFCAMFFVAALGFFGLACTIGGTRFRDSFSESKMGISVKEIF